MIKLEAINKTYQVGGSPLRALRDVSLQIGPESISVLWAPRVQGSRHC